MEDLTGEVSPVIFRTVLTTQERNKLVGARIREARGQAAGTKRDGSMSQKDLAKRLAEMRDSNVDSELRSVLGYEAGDYSPRLARLQAIAEATGKPLDYFAVDGGGDADGIEGVRFREVV